MKDRIIPMRWLLTWKPLTEPASPGDRWPHEGQSQEILIGYRTWRSEIPALVPGCCRQPLLQ